MTVGFTIIAYNTDAVDYVQCASILARNLKQIMPSIPVCLISNAIPSKHVFDEVIEAPDLAVNSSWKLINDVHATLSPWQNTIKLEADMWVPVDISWWFDVLKQRDINICTTIRNFRGNISTVDFYRQTHIKNKLLNTYNAITYYSKCELVNEFYAIVKNCFENWKSWESLLEFSNEEMATTDVVYALAAETLGKNHFYLPTFSQFSFAHMKRAINNLRQEKWNHELIVEMDATDFRINTFPQLYPVHYHVKEFSNILGEHLGG